MNKKKEEYRYGNCPRNLINDKFNEKNFNKRFDPADKENWINENGSCVFVRLLYKKRRKMWL